MKTYGENVRELRRAKGLTTYQLADAAGISQGQISRIETKNHHPRPAVEKMMAAALDVTVAELQNIQKPWLIPDSHSVPLLAFEQIGTDGATSPRRIYTDVPTSESAFAMVIKRLEMAPEYRMGDVVIIDPAAPPSLGGVVMGMSGDVPTLMQYGRSGQTAGGVEIFALYALNRDYADPESGHKSLRVLGSVVEHRRYFINAN